MKIGIKAMAFFHILEIINNIFLQLYNSISIKLLLYIYINLFIILIIFNREMGIGDGGLGIGDWGLGPIPNPQSPIPNPQSPLILIIFIFFKNIIYI